MSTKAFLWLLAGVLVLGVGVGGAIVGVVAMGGDEEETAAPASVQASSPQSPGQRSQGQRVQESSKASNITEASPAQSTGKPEQGQPSQVEETPSSGIQTPPLEIPEQPSPGQLSQEELAELRQRVQSGEASQEDLARMREQFQRGFGQRAGGDGQEFPAGPVLTGTVESAERNTVTVNTPEGPLQATVGPDTNIQKIDQGSLKDLVVGARLTLIGQRGEDGTVQAGWISILPEGLDGFGGGGLAGRFDQGQFGEGPGGRQFGQRQGGQGESGGGPDGQDFTGAPVLTGTVEKVDGKVVTVNTPQGPLQAAVGADTNIQKITQGTLEDLVVGVRVTVIGRRGEDGTVLAEFITITLEGAPGFPRGGFPGGRGLPAEEPENSRQTP